MKKILFSILTLPAFLLGEWDELFRGDGDPCLAHHVNVMSGNLQLFSEDAVVDGAVPIHLVRSYSSAGASERRKRGDLNLKKLNLVWQMEGGWSFLPHLQIIIDPRLSGYSDLKVYLREPSGEMITYKVSSSQGLYEHTLIPEKKLGHGFGVISGRLNPNNNVLYVNYKDGRAAVECADGGRRVYKGSERNFIDSLADHGVTQLQRDLRHYLLQEEISPSGQVTRYEYGDRNIKISKLNPSRTKTYASVLIEELHHKPPFSIKITTSDLREIRYEGWSFKNQEYLNFVANGTTVLDDIFYTKTRKGRGASIRQINSWGDEKIHIEYHKPASDEEGEKWEKKPYKKPHKIDKVKALTQLGQTIATFRYTSDTTDVRDCNNVLTRYHYKKDELLLIEYFDQNQELYSSQKFIWVDKNLIAKLMCDKEGNAIFSKTFQYNTYGDIIKESLYGNFSGERESSFSFNEIGSLVGSELYSKKYEYDPKTHLLIYDKENNGLAHRYTYLEGTDNLLTKLTYDKNDLLITQEFSYDADNLLISEVTDDGTTHFEKRYERDPITARIIALEDGLSRIEYSYSPHNQIACESIFDATKELVYSITYQYDRLGHLLSKSTPSGNKNNYTYAYCGDLLSSKEVGSPETKFTYDAFHRPISSTVNNKTSYTTYNAKGLITSKTDHIGNRTEYQYDPFDRCSLTIFPEVIDEIGIRYHPTMECAYDLLGNTILCKNSKGEVKKTDYNVLSKPILEIFPDGSKVRYFYQVGGGPKKTVTQDGSETLYTHDIFGRMTSKVSPLFKEKWSYSPSSLLSYTDQTGLMTTFDYDIFGRKITEETSGRKTEYTYDRLNFLESTTTDNLTTNAIHDIEGRIISDDEYGENLTFYTYDDENRKTKIVKTTSRDLATDTLEYDDEGNIISHTDPTGATTQFLYEDQTKTILDPLGNQTIEIYDALTRLVHIEKKSPSGMTVSVEENFYDRSGNLSRKVSHIYENGQFIRQPEIKWEYDFRGLVLKEVQLDRVTTNVYDLLGRLIKRTLPSGVALTHTYDREGRLSSLESSDGTIHYLYEYALDSNPIKIEDDIHLTFLKREYNQFGELIHEINDQKLSYSWEYDLLGRKTALTLPDGSKIAYSYEGSHMKKIERISPSGTSLYHHTYDNFDQNGHVQQESLIKNIGIVVTKRDLLERPYLVKSPLHKEAITYGSSGLVTATDNSLFIPKNYEYDSLNQLIKEKNKEYPFNSIGNISNLEVNEYSELTSKFIYDPNGNPTKRIHDSVEYTYDALGRLTQAGNVKFTYDAYSRLSSKKVGNKKKLYLYDQELEIGSVNSNGTLIDLKVLGLGIDQDIGAAIAIELEGEVYAPLHDFHGNIIALIEEHGDITEVYEYDAFGREVADPDAGLDINPWRFCSKRKEEGLIYFGRRFYDPEFGRWLTPDPLGFFESVNSYLYTLNSPLNRLDLFGLYSGPDRGFYPKNQFQGLMGDVPRYDRPLEITMCSAILAKTPFAAPVDCIVISNFMHKLNYTPMEKLLLHKVNFLNHMDQIVSKDPGVIGIITGQNGINTSLEEFISNSKNLMSNIHEGTTYIGTHNKSEGLSKDLSRTTNAELKNRTLTPNATQTGRFIGIIADSLGNIRSQSYWLHVPHSEAGVLFNLGYTTLSDSQKTTLKNQLIVFAVAPAEPISWQHSFESDNIYSDKDCLTGPLGKKYKNNPDYNISYIKCESPRKEFSAYIADHAFTGTTYRNATTRKTKDLRRDYGFHDSRKR